MPTPPDRRPGTSPTSSTTTSCRGCATLTLAADLLPHERVYSLQVLARALRERIAELQAAHESQLEEVLDRFHALRGQVGEYHALLAG